MLIIDRTTYNKAARYPIGHGYDRRPKGYAPMSILVHSTNNQRKTTFRGEAEYLFTSPYVAAHYLIGKTEADGVAQILDDGLRAWHAGLCSSAYLNSKSIGIELHISLGERPTAHQISALTELCAGLMHKHNIPHSLIETHRAAALPPGRKRDPEGIDQISFLAWRRKIVPAPFGTDLLRYRVKVVSARIRNKPNTRAGQVGSLTKGKTARGQLVAGQALDDGGRSNNQWLKLAEGQYIWSGLLEVVP